MRRADPGDYKQAVLKFVQLLARAAHQFRTYPATSPLCHEAADDCHAAFVGLELDEPLRVRVTSRQLLLDDESEVSDPAIEHDLRKPLHTNRVTSIEFDRHASLRDWTHFCAVLASSLRSSRDAPTIAESLLDAGVGGITPRMAPRPEVFEIGTPPAPVVHLVNRERQRLAAAEPPAGPAQYLYPPDKGWVRLDLTSTDTTISLVDLTVLVNAPDRLAAMLARLVDDAAADAGDGAPLGERYDDVVRLIGALEPRLGRMLLSKLARTVLDLEPDRRRALLRRSILPHLLDGRPDSEAILAEFPDVELADALHLLLELETASPQLLSVALDRLRLAPDRRQRMMPLIEARLNRDGTLRARDRWAAAGFDHHAQNLIRIDAAASKDFGEFAAFDLAIDEATAAELDGVRVALAGEDDLEAWLGCTLAVARIEPNPAVVAALLSRVVPVLHGFVQNERWPDATRWMTRVSQLAESVAESRPEVASVISEALVRLCDRQTLLRLARVGDTEAGRVHASTILAAVGPSIVPAWLAALATPADRTPAMRLRALLCTCSRRVGASIAQQLPTLRADVAAVAVTVLGSAGAGFEAAIATQVTEADPSLAREALRALARIASPKAAGLITWHLEHSVHIQAAAEEALWRLPSAVALSKARELLGRREFVARHPHSAGRLLERAVHSRDDAGLEPVLAALAPLRFHFWSPALARVGAKARGLL